MAGDFRKGDNVTHSDDDDLAHTSSSLRSDNTFSARHSKGAEEVEQEIDTQTRQNSEPHSRKRIRVDDDVDTTHSDNSHTSRHHSPRAHVQHKHKSNSSPSASMRLYKRSLSLALRHARRQPITRSLTTRLTRSGAKFFKHDIDSELPSPSSRSANPHGEHHYTPTSAYSSPLHGSPKHNNIKHAAKQASPSKIDLNRSSQKSIDKDALLDLNEDIAIRYLNSSPSFYTLLDLDFDLGNELKGPSTSALPNEDHFYLGPGKDMAIKHDGSSPKLYTLFDGMDSDVLLDSPTPSSPEASSSKVKDSNVRPHSPANLKHTPPRTRALSSSSSPRNHTLQDHHDSKSRPTSSTSSNPKRHLLSLRAPSLSQSLTSPKYASSGKSIVKHLLSLRSRRSSRSPSLSYSPTSPKYAPSGKSIARLLETRSPSPSYSPASIKYTPSSSKDPPKSFSSLELRSPRYSPTSSDSKSSSPSHNNHLFSSRSPSPKRAPISPTYVPSPSLNNTPKGKLPCVPSFKPSKPRTFKFKGSDSSSSSPSSKYSPRKRLCSRSPTSSHPLRSQYRSPRPPSPMLPSFHQKESPQTNLRASKIKYSTNLDELIQSLSPYWTQVDEPKPTSSPPQSWPPNQSALNHPSSRARSPSLSSQGSPTSSTLVDHYSQVRPTYSLFPMSSPGRSNLSRTDRRSAHAQTPRLPDLNLPPLCQSRLSSTPGQGLPSNHGLWSCGRGTPPSFTLSSTQSPCSPIGQHHVSFSSPTNSSHNTRSRHGEQMAGTVQNNRSRPYRQTPHTIDLQYLENFLQAGSSETVGPRSRDSPSNKSTSARPRGRKSSDKGALPWQSHGVPSPTSSKNTSYYSALSSPSRFEDVSSHYQGAAPSSRRDLADIPSPTSSAHTSYYSALSSPSWYQDGPSRPSPRLRSPATGGQGTYYSAQSTPLSSHTSYHTAPRSPSWYQPHVTTSVQDTYFSAQSKPSPGSRAFSHAMLDLNQPPLYQETYYSAPSRTPPPGFYNSQPTKHQTSDYCPSEQETYYSAQGTPSPSFYDAKATVHTNFDHYPLTPDSWKTARSQRSWLERSPGSHRHSSPSVSATKMHGASTSSSAYGDHNRAASARARSPASTRGHSSTRSPSRTARSSRKRPSSGEEGKGASKQHKSH